jgi:lactase-phlorizin hydrolase
LLCYFVIIDCIRLQIGEKSAAQGYEQSRLPTFTVEEMANNRGTTDFLGINHYTSNWASNIQADVNSIDFFADMDVQGSGDVTRYR